MFRWLPASGRGTVIELAPWIIVLFYPPLLCQPLKASWERTGAITNFQPMEDFLDGKKKKLKGKFIKSNSSRNKMAMVSPKEFQKRKKKKKKENFSLNKWSRCSELCSQPRQDHGEAGMERQRKKIPKTQIGAIHHLGLELMPGEERILTACDLHLKRTGTIFHHC